MKESHVTIDEKKKKKNMPKIKHMISAISEQMHKKDVG